MLKMIISQTYGEFPNMNALRKRKKKNSNKEQESNLQTLPGTCGRRDAAGRLCIPQPIRHGKQHHVPGAQTQGTAMAQGPCQGYEPPSGCSWTLGSGFSLSTFSSREQPYYEISKLEEKMKEKKKNTIKSRGRCCGAAC